MEPVPPMLSRYQGPTLVYSYVQNSLVPTTLIWRTFNAKSAMEFVLGVLMDPIQAALLAPSINTNSLTQASATQFTATISVMLTLTPQLDNAEVRQTHILACINNCATCTT